MSRSTARDERSAPLIDVVDRIHTFEEAELTETHGEVVHVPTDRLGIGVEDIDQRRHDVGQRGGSIQQHPYRRAGVLSRIGRARSTSYNTASPSRKAVCT